MSHISCGVELLDWEDLTDDEKETATETYIAIREWEECRSRNEVTDEYPEPIDPTYVENCSFLRDEYGCIEVII